MHSYFCTILNGTHLKRKACDCDRKMLLSKETKSKVFKIKIKKNG